MTPPRKSQNTCCDAALIYQQLGWFPLPIHPEEKKPLIPWAHRKDQRPTKEEIVFWFDRWPNARIGVATGRLSEVEAVDCDSLEALEKLCSSCNIPETLAQQTGRAEGGRHLFFKYSGKIKTATGVNGMALDVRSDGAIVVLPPSLHASGKRYQWIGSNPLTEGLGALADLPEDLLQVLPQKVQGDYAASPPPGDGRLRNIGKIYSALKHINPDESYTLWIEIGMALHHSSGGGREGLWMWDSWSQSHSSTKYTPRECEFKWATFGRR